MQENRSVVSLYVVKTVSGQYFAGFDAEKQQASLVADPREGKFFTNKHDIKLRPEEQIVELQVDLSKVEVKISEPFRPHRKTAPRK